MEVWGIRGFVIAVSLGSKCSLGQERREEFRNVFAVKKADFGRM